MIAQLHQFPHDQIAAEGEHPAGNEAAVILEGEDHGNDQAVVNIPPFRGEVIEGFKTGRGGGVHAVHAHDQVVMPAPLEEGGTLQRVAHGGVPPFRGEGAVQTGPRSVRIVGGPETVCVHPECVVRHGIDAGIFAETGQLAGLFKMESIIADSVCHSFGHGSGGDEIGKISCCGFSGLLKFPVKDLTGIFLAGNEAAGVQSVGKIIFPVVIKGRSGAAGLPLVFQRAHRFLLLPVDQVRTGQVAVVMGSGAEAAGVVPAVQQIEHVEHAVVCVRDHISHPGIESGSGEILDGMIFFFVPDCDFRDQCRSEKCFRISPVCERDRTVDKVFVGRFAIDQHQQADAIAMEGQVVCARSIKRHGEADPDGAPVRVIVIPDLYFRFNDRHRAVRHGKRAVMLGVVKDFLLLEILRQMLKIIFAVDMGGVSLGDADRPGLFQQNAGFNRMKIPLRKERERILFCTLFCRIEGKNFVPVPDHRFQFPGSWKSLNARSSSAKRSTFSR